MTALLLSAIDSSGRKTSVALAADLLVTVVLPGQHLEGWLDGSTTKTKYQVEGRLLLDVVVRESPSVLKLLTSEDKSLLVRGDTFLILNLSLHVLDGIRSLNIEGDGLASQRLYEDLHLAPFVS